MFQCEHLNLNLISYSSLYTRLNLINVILLIQTKQGIQIKIAYYNGVFSFVSNLKTITVHWNSEIRFYLIMLYKGYLSIYW